MRSLSAAPIQTRLFDELARHPSVLKREGLVQPISNRVIPAGSEWNQVISEHLKRANIFIILVSADFLASDYCYDVEMKRALERHESGSARVIPIIVRPCSWSFTPFGRLQALPRDAKPITTWIDRDAEWASIIEALRLVYSEIKKTDFKK